MIATSIPATFRVTQRTIPPYPGYIYIYIIYYIRLSSVNRELFCSALPNRRCFSFERMDAENRKTTRKPIYEYTGLSPNRSVRFFFFRQLHRECMASSSFGKIFPTTRGVRVSSWSYCAVKRRNIILFIDNMKFKNFFFVLNY